MKIKELETEVGLALFDRSSRKVSLTMIGEYVLAYTQRVLAAMRDAEDMVARFRGLKTGVLDVAMVSTAKYFLPRLLARFRDEHPGVEVRLQVASNREQVVAVAGDLRSEEHTSELQSRSDLVCRLLLEKKKELTKMQLDNQKEIAEMQNETQKEIAGIQSATSRQNTKDQVYAQNEMLAYQQKESTARVASIMENTNLSKQQQVFEIMRQMLTQAQTACQYFTNDQIKVFFFKVSADPQFLHPFPPRRPSD